MGYTLDFDFQRRNMGEFAKIRELINDLTGSTKASWQEIETLRDKLVDAATKGQSLAQALRSVATSSAEGSRERQIVSDIIQSIRKQTDESKALKAAIESIRKEQELFFNIVQKGAAEAKKAHEAEIKAANDEALANDRLRQTIDRLVESEVRRERAARARTIREVTQQQRRERREEEHETANFWTGGPGQGAGFLAGAASKTFGFGLIGGLGLQAGREFINLIKEGVGDMTTRFYESARATEIFAARLSVSIKQAKEYQAIAKISGIDEDAFASSIRMVSQALLDSSGTGKHAAQAMQALGVSTVQADGHMRDIGEVTVEIIDKLSKINDKTERAGLAMRLLGREAKEILPLIDAYQSLHQRLEQLGVDFDEQVVKKGAEAKRELETLKVVYTNLKDQMAAKLAPIVIDFLINLTTFFSNKKEPGFVEGVNGVRHENPKAPRHGFGFLIDEEVRNNIARTMEPFGLGDENDALNPGWLKLRSYWDARVKEGNKIAANFLARNSRENLVNLKSELRELDAGVPGSTKFEEQPTAALQGLLRSKQLPENKVTDVINTLSEREKKRIELEDKIKAIEQAPHKAEELKRFFESAVTKYSNVDENPLRKLLNEFDKLVNDPLWKQLDEGRRERIRSAFSHAFMRTELSENDKAFEKQVQTMSAMQHELDKIDVMFRKDNGRDDLMQMLLRMSGVSTRFGHRGMLEQTLPPIDTEISPQQQMRMATGMERLQLRQLDVLTRDYGRGAQRGLRTEGDDIQKRADIQINAAKAMYDAELRIAAKETNIIEQKQKERDADEKFYVKLTGIRMEAEDRIFALRQKQHEQETAFLEGMIKSAFKGIGAKDPGQALREYFKSFGVNTLEKILDNELKDVKLPIPHAKAGTRVGKALSGTLFGPDADKINPTLPNPDYNEIVKDHGSAMREFARSLRDGLRVNIVITGSGGGGGWSVCGGDIAASATSSGSLIMPSIGNTSFGSGAVTSSSTISYDTAPMDEDFGLSSYGRIPYSAPGSAGIGHNVTGAHNGSASFGAGLSGATSGSSLPGISKGLNSGLGILNSIPKLAKSIANSGFGKFIGKQAGNIGSIGAGVLGALSGFGQHGASGIIGGVSGIAGAVGGVFGMLSSIAPALGPFALPLQAIGMIGSIVGSLFHSSRQARADKIKKNLDASVFLDRIPLSFSQGLGGGFSDFDANGQARGSNLSPFPQVNEPHYTNAQGGNFVLAPGSIASPFGAGNQGDVHLHVSAIDQASVAHFFQNNRESAGEAIRELLMSGNGLSILNAIGANT